MTTVRASLAPPVFVGSRLRGNDADRPIAILRSPLASRPPQHPPAVREEARPAGKSRLKAPVTVGSQPAGQSFEDRRNLRARRALAREVCRAEFRLVRMDHWSWRQTRTRNGPSFQVQRSLQQYCSNCLVRSLGCEDI